MATDLGRVKSPPPAKHDTFVAAQLDRAEKRIRGLDLATGLLGLLALTAAYALFMVLADHLLDQAPAFRQGAFVLFVVGAGAYTAYYLGRPLTRRVNPYFAARQVEQTLPGSKNSVVNWLDTRSKPLPSAILGAVGQRAAKDLARADLEQAVSGRRAGWACGLSGIALFLLFILMIGVGGPRPFLSRLGRAFAPFASASDGPATRLTLLRPEGGDAAAVLGQPLAFTVRVEGTVPDPRGAEAVRLLYRYQEAEPYLERQFQEEGDREWTITLPPADVRNGLWYKVAGGDSETPEFRVTVHTAPQVEDFRVTYRAPKHSALPIETSRERRLKALRGSEAVITVRTNRRVREARLEFAGKGGPLPPVKADPLADDPHSFRINFPLNERGLYRLGFSSSEGELFTEPGWQSVEVTEDQAPVVELTLPGRDVTIPADGLLHLAGVATDDLGVHSIMLRMQSEGQRLLPREYRSPDKLRLPAGGYPRRVEYQDDIDLANLHAADGTAFTTAPEMVLEYWLEASDARAPEPNIGASKHYCVKVGRSEYNPTARQHERQRAAVARQEHERRQDREIQSEDRQRNEEREKAEKDAESDEQQRREQAAEKNAADSTPESSGQEKSGKDTTQAPNAGKPGESEKPGSPNKPNPDEAQNPGSKTDDSSREGKEGDQLARELQNKLNDARGRQPGAGKTEPDNANNSKPEDRGSEVGKQPGDQAANPNKGHRRPTADQRRRESDKPGEKGGSSNTASAVDKPGSPKPDGSSDSGTPTGQYTEKPKESQGPGQVDRSPRGPGAESAQPRDKATDSKNSGAEDKPGATGNPERGQKPGPNQPREKPGERDNGTSSKPNPVSEKPGAEGPAGSEKPSSDRRTDGPRNANDRNSGTGTKTSHDAQGSNPTTGDKREGNGPAKDPANPRDGNSRIGQPERPTDNGNENGNNSGPKATRSDKQSGPDGTKGGNEEGSKPGKRGSSGNGPMNSDGKEPGKTGTQSGAREPSKRDGSDSVQQPDSGFPNSSKPRSEGTAKPGTNATESGVREAGSDPGNVAEKNTGGKNRGDGARDSGQPKAETPSRGSAEGAKSDFKNATAEDVDWAAAKLGSKNANEASKGMKDLAQILKEAKSEEVRQAARKAVHDAIVARQEGAAGESKHEKNSAPTNRTSKPSVGKGGNEERQNAESPGGATPSKEERNGPDGTPGERKNRGEHDRGDGTGKEPGGKQDTVKPPSDSSGKSDGFKQGTGQGDGGQSGEGTGKEPGKEGGGGPGGGNLSGRNNSSGSTTENVVPTPANPQPGRHRDASTLQLQDWRNALKELRQSGKYSEAELQNLGKRLEQWERTHQARPQEEKVAPNNSGNLSSSGGRLVRPTGTGGKPGDLKAGAAPQPPASYRDAFRQFNRPKAVPSEAGDSR